MIDLQTLNSNPELSELTDSQKSIILEMAKNAESVIIGNKTSEIYKRLDDDIFNASGVEKEGSEKTYKYAVRAIEKLKSLAEENSKAKESVSKLQSQISDLQKQLKDGSGDKKTAEKLEAVLVELKEAKEYNAEIQLKLENSEKEWENKLHTSRVKNELNAALSGLNFKGDLQKSVLDLVKRNTISELMEKYSFTFEEVEGTEVLFFTDKNTGSKITNKANKLNPYTPTEMLSDILKDMDVLCTGKQQTGLGLKPPNQKQKLTTVDLSGATTSEERSILLDQQLQELGYKPGTREYTEQRILAQKEYLNN